MSSAPASRLANALIEAVKADALKTIATGESALREEQRLTLVASAEQAMTSLKDRISDKTQLIQQLPQTLYLIKTE